MSNLLSLSKARKAKVRAAKEQQAGENRVLFGRTKAQKLLEKAEKALAEKRIRGHRLIDIPDA